MRRLVTRLAFMLGTLVVLSAVLFALLTSIPGNAVDMLVTSNPGVRPEDVTRLVRLRGLDRPWYVQYARWAWGWNEARRPPAWEGPTALVDGAIDLREHVRSELPFTARIVDGEARVEGTVVRATGRTAVVITDAAGLETGVWIAADDAGWHWSGLPVAVVPDPARSLVELRPFAPTGTTGVRVVDGPGTMDGFTWHHAFAGPGQQVVTLEASDDAGHRARALLVVDHGLVPHPDRFQPGILRGDAGFSSTYKQPVSTLLSGRIGATLELVLPALLLSLLFAIGLGGLAARRPGGALDRAVNALAYAGMSVPVFWLALLAILLFAVRWQLLPPGGRETPGDGSVADRAAHAVLPVAVLTFLYAGRFLRHVRSALVEVLRQDHVRTSRALGIPERVILWKHALLNALIPLVTVLGLSVPSLFSGAVLTETVFSWPGMGRLLYESVLNGDHYVAMIAFLVSAALVMAANAAVDALYGVIDPRTREAR